MMLVLAVRTDAERVYERALQLLHARRDRRGVRRRARRRQPDAAAHGDEAGRPRPARPVPRAGARRDGRSRSSAGARSGSCSRPRSSSCAVVRRARWSANLLSPAHDLGDRRHADCGTGNADDPHGPVGAVGDVGAVRRVPPRRLGARRRADRATAADGSGSTPTAAATARSRRRCCPPDELPRRAARPRCRATRPACAASSGPSSSRPSCGAPAYYLFPGGCVTYRVRVRRRRETRVADLRRRQRARVPAPRATLVDDGARRRPVSACAAPARRRARADRDGAHAMIAASVSRASSWCRVVAAIVVAIVTTVVSLRLLGIRRGWGTALLAGVVGWGVGALVALGLADWDWGADGLDPPHVRHRHPGDDGGGGHARPARAPGLAGDRRAGRPRRRARARSARSGSGSRCSAATASWCGSPGARASARSSPPAGRAERTVEPIRASACGACSRRPAASTSSSVRSPRPASTSSRPRSATSWPSSRTGSPPEPIESIRRGAGGRARRQRRERLRRVRLGAARGGVDRPDLPRPAAHRAKRRREGAAPGHRRRHGARPRRARARSPTSRSGAPRSARASARARCSDSSRESLRAELDFRREADAMTR